MICLIHVAWDCFDNLILWIRSSTSWQGRQHVFSPWKCLRPWLIDFVLCVRWLYKINGEVIWNTKQRVYVPHGVKTNTSYQPLIFYTSLSILLIIILWHFIVCKLDKKITWKSVLAVYCTFSYKSPMEMPRITYQAKYSVYLVHALCLGTCEFQGRSGFSCFKQWPLITWKNI